MGLRFTTSIAARFLICNNVPGVTGQFSGNITQPQQDLSYRNNGTATVPNSLGDLSVRKNRAFHKQLEYSRTDTRDSFWG